MGKLDAANKASAKRKGKPTPLGEALVAATGITPLEVMLKAMREFHDEAQKARGEERRDLLIRAADLAKDAAPYVHPRLTAIAHSGPGGGAIPHSVTVELVSARATA